MTKAQLNKWQFSPTGLTWNHQTTLRSRSDLQSPHVPPYTPYSLRSIYRKPRPSCGDSWVPMLQVRPLCRLWPSLGSQQIATAPAIVQLVQHSAPIDVLDDNSLLNIICLYQPPLSDGDEGYSDCILLGLEWNHERWWYKLTHICQRWRHLILGFISYLGLCLLCTQGTPVADMLAHSPPFLIIIDHFHKEHHIHDDCMMENNVEGIILALAHHDRMRRICFQTPLPTCYILGFVQLSFTFFLPLSCHLTPTIPQSPDCHIT